MKKASQPELFVTGIGITAAIGQGKAAFLSALLKGKSAFAVMQRPGRQYTGQGEAEATLIM